MACSATEPIDPDPATQPPPRRRRGRPPIHLSLSLNLVMPSQFFPEGGDGPGERRLMRAVLKDALTVLFKYDATQDRRGQRLLADAQHWLESDDADWPFSFVNVCDALGLDPSCVRERVARYRAAQRARPGASRGAAAGSAARISPPSGRSKYS